MRIPAIVKVAGPTQEKLQVALRMIGDLIQTAEVGKTYLGRVARFRYVSRIPDRDTEKVVEFGAFVTILRGLDGLLPPSTHALPGIYGHVSELAHHRVANPADEVSEAVVTKIPNRLVGKDGIRTRNETTRTALVISKRVLRPGSHGQVHRHRREERQDQAQPQGPHPQA